MGLYQNVELGLGLASELANSVVSFVTHRY